MKLYQMDVKSAFLNGFINEQVYVDDIIFGSTNEDFCKEFGELMSKEFEMSMIGEVTFFLGFQVKQMRGDFYLSRKVYQGSSQKIQDGRMQANQEPNAN
jgi:hypothetical protein